MEEKILNKAAALLSRGPSADACQDSTALPPTSSRASHEGDIATGGGGGCLPWSKYQPIGVVKLQRWVMSVSLPPRAVRCNEAAAGP